MRSPPADLWKRPLDIVLVTLASLPAALLALVVALSVWVSLGRPILIHQLRPGRRGVGFRLHKFRTMLPSATDETDDAVRLTKFGRWLRSTSLDELPELWNVLRGDMSLVGPRPLLMQYLPLYTAEQARRHEVRPGITGWAQVNGRNAQSWEDRFRLDVWYVDHMSLRLDLKILLMTVAQVIARRDIDQPGHATREPFRGNG